MDDSRESIPRDPNAASLLVDFLRASNPQCLRSYLAGLTYAVKPVVGWQVAVGEVSGSYADHPYHHPGIIVRTSGEVVSVPGGALRQLGSTGDWRGEALPPHEGPAVALDGYKAAERVLADLVVEHGLG